MVSPTDLNLQSLRSRSFEGFVQLQIPDGTIWYRLRERQTMSFNMNYDKIKHYSDDGVLVVDPAGTSHSFTMNIKLTSDMFDDTVWTFTSGILDKNITFGEKNTLSYWIYKNEIREPITIIFVTSFTTLSGPVGDLLDNDVNIKFVLSPDSFTSSLGASGGSPEIIVSGIVTSITNAARTTTTDQ